uniref:hypothetical protein n=1 Tax=uncultured Gimesia sp. TaxID=1678688 RepID=UPI002614D8BD
NMNFIYQTVKKIIAIFGFTTFVITLTIILIFNMSFLRDDPYIIGFFSSMFLVPGWILYIIFEQYPKRFINKYSAFICYSFFPLLFFSIIVIYGGQGSGYGFIFGIYFLVSTVLSLPLLKQLEKQYIFCVFVALGFTCLFGFLSSVIRY